MKISAKQLVIACCVNILLLPAIIAACVPSKAHAVERRDLLALGLTPLGGAAETIVEIVDGDTLVLASGQQVRLVGVQAPKLPLRRKGFKPWPLSMAAKNALATMALGKQAHLFVGQTGLDRHGRLLAHVWVARSGRTADRDGEHADGVWLQDEMLRAGLARVYSFSDNRAALDPLFAAERAARQAGAGVWQHPYYRVRSAHELSNAVKSRTYFGDRFELVEGQVAAVTIFRDRAYVNFGTDWRDDFSLMINLGDVKNFGQDKQAGRAFLESLTGQKIRVRGWTYLKNGPMIRVTHKDRIELLDKLGDPTISLSGPDDTPDAALKQEVAQ